MTVFITWRIADLFYRADDGMVQNIYWIAEATDEGFSAIRGGRTQLEPASPESFIPFEQLTEEICSGWVFMALGAAMQEEIEQDLINQINEQKYPIILQGLPW